MVKQGILSIFFLFSSPLMAENLIISCPYKDVSFTVEIVRTSQEQAKGLMFREKLDEKAGMLFLYPTPRPIAMWMKNTPLPLDMIFSDKNGEILAIYENATPYSLTRIGPVEETAHVLEINAGIVKKYGISESCVLKLAP